MIDLVKLYGVLRGVATSKGIISREDLSRLYLEATGDWHEPQGETWDVPLADLNGHAKAAGLPPISAIVADRPRREENFEPPATGFWGSPGVPPLPRKAADRLMVWMGFVNLAHQAAWPETLAGLA
jgi:hypothetical protein